jgi:hypothetical protein
MALTSGGRAIAVVTAEDASARGDEGRLMRYAVAHKPDSEALDQFVRRKGGINACAARSWTCRPGSPKF